jgi:hypothetical protein
MDPEPPTCVICLEQITAIATLRILPCKHSYHDGCIRDYVEKAGTNPTRLGVMYANEEVMSVMPARCPQCREDFKVATFWPDLARLDTYPKNGFKFTNSVQLGDWTAGNETADQQWTNYLTRVARALSRDLPVIDPEADGPVYPQHVALICGWIIVADRFTANIDDAGGDLPDGVKPLVGHLTNIIAVRLQGAATNVIRACARIGYDLDGERLGGAYGRLSGRWTD